MNSQNEEISRLVRNINEAWKSGRSEQLHDLFHPGMVIVAPDFQELVRGRDACVESYREFAANAKVHEYTESDFKIGVWGDSAVCTYAWSVTYERNGKKSRETGTDQFVFSRRGEKWLAVYRCIHFEPAKAMQETYLQLVIREFKRMKALAEGAFSQVNDEQFFAVPSEGDNSVAVIVKHVGGNLLSRWIDFLTSDGEKPGRNRDAEFETIGADSRQSLMQQWEAGWSALFSALEPLVEADLKRTITIRGEGLSVLQAINRQLTHYSYHVGQIVYVAKHYAGNSWRTLSVARGKSAQFNAAPKKYISGA